MVDVIDSLLLVCHLVVLERPEGLILLNILLILTAEWQEEVVEELIADDFLLVADFALHKLALFNFLLTINLTIFLAVVFLKGLHFFSGQNIRGSWPERELVHLRHFLNLLQRLTEHRVDLDAAQFLIKETSTSTSMGNEEAAEHVPGALRVLVDGFMSRRLLELVSDNLSSHFVGLLQLQLLADLTKSGLRALRG